MSIGFFIVGTVIFACYVTLTLWVIFSQNKKQREENYPNYYSRHGMTDSIDMDGMGNFSRFGPERTSKKVIVKKLNKKKV